MKEVLEQAKPRQDVLDALRDRADRGASVRELVGIVHESLGLPADAVVPVLWYFTQAFSLALPDILPLRELIGTDHDAEMDALVLPLIARERPKPSK